MLPFGLPALHAIFASWRFAAKPIEHVINGPTLSAIRFLMSQTECARVGAFRWRDAARQFVDGLDRIDRNDCADFGQQRIVSTAIQIG